MKQKLGPWARIEIAVVSVFNFKKKKSKVKYARDIQSRVHISKIL